jgi:hypothetical protein
MPVKIVYSSMRLSGQLQVKDATKYEHQHDLVYIANCPEPTCNASCIGETGRRNAVRIAEHQSKDKWAHISRHSIETGHSRVSARDFTIFVKNCKGNVYRRKLTEALCIKKFKPGLSIQIASVPLKLC